jgi:hypothetical protein
MQLIKMKRYLLIIVLLLVINVASAHTVIVEGDGRVMTRTSYDIGKYEQSFINDITIIYDQKNDQYNIILESNALTIKPPLDVKNNGLTTGSLNPTGNNYYYTVKRGGLDKISFGKKSIVFVEESYLNFSFDDYGTHIISLSCDGVNQDNISLYYDDVSYKYGAEGDFEGLRNCTYLINSTANTHLGGEGFYVLGQTTVNNNVRTQEAKTFTFGDICERTLENDQLPSCSYEQYDENNNTIISLRFLTNKSIDPTVTVEYFDDYGVYKNQTEDQSFPTLHLGINESRLKLYLPFDINNSNNYTYDRTTNTPDWRIIAPTYENDCVVGGCYRIVEEDTTVIYQSDTVDKLNLSNRTVMAWVKWYEGTSAWRTLMTNNADHYIAWNDSRALRVNYLDNGGESNNIIVGNLPASFATGQWHHIAITLNGTSNSSLNISVYLNGTYTDGVLRGEGLGFDKVIRMVGKRTNDNYMNGSIDEFMMFDYALSEEEISNIVNHQLNRYHTTGQGSFRNFNTSQDGSLNQTNITLSSFQDDGTDVKVRFKEWDGVEYNDGTFGGGDPDIVLHYHFDNNSDYGESDTHVYDYSGHGNNGTVYGWAYINTSGGFYSGALTNLTNHTSRVQVPYSAMLNPENITIMLWIKFNGIDDDYQRIAASSYNSWSEQRWFLRYTGDGAGNFIEGGFYDDGGRGRSSQVSYTTVGEWIHVTLTIYNDGDSNNTALYFNGALVDSDEYDAGLCSNNNDMVVGAYYTNGGYSNTSIDELIIWNRTLTSIEIKDYYITGKLKYNNISAWKDLPAGENQSVAFDMQTSTERGLYELNLSGNGFYSPTVYGDVLFNTYAGGGGEPPEDSCTYSSGDHTYQGSDDCTISSNTDYGGNNVYCTGSGTLTVNAVMSNIGRFERNNGCHVIINTGSGGRILS